MGSAKPPEENIAGPFVWILEQISFFAKVSNKMSKNHIFDDFW